MIALRSAFSIPVSVSMNDGVGLFNLEIKGLSEDSIRKIAAALHLPMENAASGAGMEDGK